MTYRSTEQESHLQERIDKLYVAINSLSKLDRSIIVLYLEGVPTKNIAEVIGISQGNVLIRIHRSKKELSKRMRYDK